MSHTGKEAHVLPSIDNPNSVEHRRQLALAIHQLFAGHSNNTQDVTLTNGTTSTVISDRRIGPESFIILTPLTANAASMSWHVSARTNNQATITHDNTANVDQDFVYIVVGG